MFKAVSCIYFWIWWICLGGCFHKICSCSSWLVLHNFLKTVLSTIRMATMIFVRGHSKVRPLRRGGGEVIEKRTKTNRARGVLSCVYVRFLKKKMLRFSKWSFIVLLQFFLLIIMAVWNIKKKAIMEDYNEWRAITFGISTKQTLLLCTNGVHLIEIPLWLLKRHVAFNQRC